MIHDLLNRPFLGNRVLDYAAFLAILLGGMIAAHVVRRVVIHRLKLLAERTATTLDDFAVEIFRKMVVPLAYYGVFYLAATTLYLGSFLTRAIQVAGVTLLTVLVVQFAITLSRYGIRAYSEKQERDSSRDRAMAGFVTLIQVVAWSLGAVFLLDNLGFKISTVIAGLGIGGIAVALGAQAILGDLFSYFTITFDRPFEIGDFIIVGDHMGVVQHMGIKSTRISSLGGEQIVVSNKDLTDSRVRNYKRMARRRVLFRIGVTYQTPLARLKEIPEIIEGVVREIEDAVFDRAHFFSYGDFSLVYEVVYYVLGNDYTKYMDIQQRINFRIHEELAAREIEFAYPTQTLYLARA
jgi:small-conductance mechanosensitive channel